MLGPWWKEYLDAEENKIPLAALEDKGPGLPRGTDLRNALLNMSVHRILRYERLLIGALTEENRGGACAVFGTLFSGLNRIYHRFEHLSRVWNAREPFTPSCS